MSPNTGRNLLAETPITHAFAHFRSGPHDAIHSEEARPVFEGLPADQQDWVTRVVLKYDPRDGNAISPLADELGVAESVAIGLSILLHPDA